MLDETDETPNAKIQGLTPTMTRVLLPDGVDCDQRQTRIDRQGSQGKSYLEEQSHPTARATTFFLPPKREAG
jgi:hypothetical protein